MSVIIPVFHNKLTLLNLQQELNKVQLELLKLSVKLEIIYLDDGSEDESLKELLKIKKNDKSVKIVKLTRNFGSVHAIKAGLGIAKGDCFSFLAAG